MKRIEMLNSRVEKLQGGGTIQYVRGTFHNFEDALAAEWVASGDATLTDGDEAKPAPAPAPAPAPESIKARKTEVTDAKN